MSRIKLVVLDEHTLGYILPEIPTDIQFLHSSILRGSPFGINQSSVIIRHGDKIRLASAEDFEAFRVSSVGFLEPAEYEYFYI